MATSTLNIAMEAQLKTDAELLCGRVGVVKCGKESAALMREQSVQNGNSDMTMDEIDGIIAVSRRERGLYDKVSAVY